MCDVPVLSTPLTTRLLALSPPQTAHLHKQYSSPQRTSRLDPRLSSLRRPPSALSNVHSVRSWRASRRPQSRAWTFSGGRPASGLVRLGFRGNPASEGSPSPHPSPCATRPPPPRPAVASSPCHTGLSHRQPGLLHVLRPRRPSPTASCFPAPAARPPQPRPPADAPPIGLRAGSPDQRLRVQYLALIGSHMGKGGAKEP